MNEPDPRQQRAIKDRRKKPTPPLSRYTFFGRRRRIRRKEESDKGGYVDRYGHRLFFFVILILGLNILDALFTMMILDLKGWEANPVVRSVMDLYGTGFWIWKFGIVSFCVVLLCLHSRFRHVKAAIVAISAIYSGIITYQIYLILRLL